MRMTPGGGEGGGVGEGAGAWGETAAQRRGMGVRASAQQAANRSRDCCRAGTLPHPYCKGTCHPSLNPCLPPSSLACSCSPPHPRCKGTCHPSRNPCPPRAAAALPSPPAACDLGSTRHSLQAHPGWGAGWGGGRGGVGGGGQRTWGRGGGVSAREQGPPCTQRTQPAPALALGLAPPPPRPPILSLSPVNSTYVYSSSCPPPPFPPPLPILSPSHP